MTRGKKKLWGVSVRYANSCVKKGTAKLIQIMGNILDKKKGIKYT